VALSAIPYALAAKPTWAKKATGFPSECREKRDFMRCKPVRIPAPDGKSSVEVFYKSQAITPQDSILEASLRVTTPRGGTVEMGVPWGFQDIDLLWSPDSKAFFINGGRGSAIAGFFVYVYLLDGPAISEIQSTDLTRAAMRDMVHSFPPCKAASLDLYDCKAMETDPDYYNMSGLDWVGDSSHLLVLAQVPCTSRFGGIMCEAMGYVLHLPTGRILRRIEAKELKSQWQKSIAFNLEVPEPPEYERR
jgi:hypothetical protein